MDLNHASNIGDFEMVKRLIESGVKVEYRSIYNCINNRYIDILYYLIDHNDNLNLLDSKGNTYLFYTVMYNLYEASKYLIEKGCNVNIINNDGLTPLYFSMFTDNSQLIELLINHANINIVNLNKDTLLHIASKRDNLYIAELLIKKGINVNALNVDNESAIFNCLKFFSYDRVVIENEEDYKTIEISFTNNIKIFDLLVRNGAWLNIKDFNKNSILHICKHNEIFKRLLKYDLNINDQNNNGFTPLHIITQKGNLEIVNLLIDKGALLDIKSNYGNTALHYAIQNKYEDVSKLLIDKGADVNIVNNQNVYPIHRAIDISSISIVKHLVENGADLDVKNHNGLNVLSMVCCHSNIEILRYLFRQDQMDSQCNFKCTALHYAVSRGNNEIIKFLIDHKANLNILDYRDKTPIYIAVIKGNIDIVEYLIKHGADLYFDKAKPNLLLQAACIEGYDDIMELLIREGMDIYSLDNRGNTLLHIAASKGHINSLKCLLKYDIVITTNDNKATPLHLACCNESIEFIKCLVDNIKDKEKHINEALANKHTCLYIAIEKKNIRLVKYLVSNGALVNIKDGIGNSPLHMAMYYDNEIIIRYLVYSNADIYIKNNLNISPMDIAIRNDRSNLMFIDYTNKTYVDKDELCKICLLIYNEHNLDSMVLYCNHRYCSLCIKGLQDNDINKCPTCKRFCIELI